MGVRGVWLAAAAMAAALGPVAAGPAGGQPAMASGYLAELPSSLALLPPPPAPGSAAQARDEEASRAALALHGSPRWELATQDAVLGFPAAAQTFTCALGVPVSEADTPALYRLLRRTVADLGRAPYPTKNKYKRTRPFVVNGQPQCTPELDQVLRGDGSYPSGHSAIGWGWGLILAQVAPDRGDALVARGRVFSDSRRVCNVHWLSDVEEGRVVADAVVARLNATPEFQADVAAARAEVAKLRAAGAKPTRDCAREAAQIAAGG